jgi:hypothetical protein
MPEVIPSQIYLINTDFILMDYGLIIARVLEKCKQVHICFCFECVVEFVINVDYEHDQPQCTC